jgi:hypothetical protein
VYVRSNAGGYIAEPQAIFYEAAEPTFPDSRSRGDTCRLGDLVTQGIGQVRSLDAGDSIAFTLGGRTAYLRPVNSGLLGLRTYVASDPVEIVPGSPVAFQIPGGRSDGYPAASLSALTAPALTAVSTVPGFLDPDQTAISVSWAPAGDDSSRFEIALQYASEGSSILNRNVVCQFNDDGQAAISRIFLAEWINSPLRRVEISRYRTALRRVGSGVLFFLATFDTVASIAP